MMLDWIEHDIFSRLISEALDLVTYEGYELMNRRENVKSW